MSSAPSPKRAPSRWRRRSSAAIAAQPAWAARPVAERAAILRRAADLYEANAVEFFALATREAGKTLADGVAEVREAVDFLRYYAAEAAEVEAGTSARGVIVCISPWNFPLAIFTGQIAAALVDRQCGDRQARRADAADRRARRARCCTRPACRKTCSSCCRATARRSARR